MTKIDDLKALIADLKAAQTEQLAAIDKEIQQLADAVGALPPDQQASFQESLDNLTAATAAMRASTAKLAGDDAPTT